MLAVLDEHSANKMRKVPTYSLRTRPSLKALVPQQSQSEKYREIPSYRTMPVIQQYESPQTGFVFRLGSPALVLKSSGLEIPHL